MRTLHNHQKNLPKDSQRGTVLIELALILPLILLLTLTGFDFIRLIQAKNMAASMSKELATIATRRCEREIDDVQTCLEEVIYRLDDFIENTGDDKVVLFASVLDRDGTNPSWLIKSASPFSPPVASKASSVILPRLQPGTGSEQHINLTYLNRVFVAECYFEYRAMFSFIERFINLDRGSNNQEYIYDVTIL